MIKLKNYFSSAALVMMLAACSGNYDTPSGDTPVPTESYETVLNYFKEINTVPRPSRHEDKMREYLREFAQTRGLRLIEDNGNIIIYKDATTGMENIPMVCLQTHMDMVCVAADGYDIDFLTQGIEQYNDGQFIWSKDHKTSLGADDGIGMAIVLAVLDSKGVAHGPLECLFTWNEEDGLDGSAALSPDILKSPYMINIDWEWEGETCIGTAGGIMMAINLPYQTEAVGDDCDVLKLQIAGVAGGHSGVAINNGGASAIKLLADFLNSEANGLRIADIEGGSAPNAISTSAKATVVVPSGQKELFTEHFNTYMAEAKQQYAQTDPNMTYTVESAQASACMKAAETGLLLKGLSGAPQGVTEWSTEVVGMFETSNNVGVVGMADGLCTVNYYTRGFNDEKMDGVAVSIEQAYEVGTSTAVSDRYSSYSAWTADLNSSLMLEAREAWESLFGTEMKLVRVGGGMETSNFAVSYPSMQIFTFGPNVYDAHTINEHVEISSIEHNWLYMLELLKKI
jgi:dipeptidase D